MTDTHFDALRAAGLLHNDSDIVRMFDTSDPHWIAKARVSKPSLFHLDAKTATTVEYEAGLRAITRPTHRERPKPAPDFDALKATPGEYDAEMRRLGWY